MGEILSKVFGTYNDFKPNTGGVDFNRAISSAQGGINQNFAGQNNLAQALMAQMSGVGPNPAQAMLNNATNNAIKQNTAMMASQKGINPGTTQRLAAMNAANQTQQAAGQGAVLNAQQQLAAQGQLGGLYGQIGNQQQNNLNGYQAALANNNNISSGVAQANANAAGNALGTAVSSASGLGGFAASHMGGGGGSNVSVTPNMPGQTMSEYQKLSSGGTVKGKPKVPGDSPKNDTVPAMLSPGEIVIPRSVASNPEKAKAFIEHLKGMKSGDEAKAPSYEEIVKLKERIKALEKKVKK